MLDVAGTSALIAQPAPALPISRLLVGRDVDEVAVLLPRLFNLCRTAQSAAVDAALGRQADTAGIAREILRDHLLKFHVTLPAFFGQVPRPLPVDWEEGGPDLRQAIFGSAGQPPATAADFFAFLEGDEGAAPALRKIDGCFLPGEAAADGLPPVTQETVWALGACDNSVAARRADHPAMAGIAGARGHGPLWRAAARLYDIEAVIDGAVPPLVCPSPGEAVVPAARGSYAVRLKMCDGQISAFDRVTPTDHLLAEGGVLDRTLATLPPTKAGLGPLLMDILDPCSPVRLKEVNHA